MLEEQTIWRGVQATYEGGRGKVLRPQEELLYRTITASQEGQTFYEDPADRNLRLTVLARQVLAEDPRTVGAIAIFARQMLGIRRIPAQLVAHLFWEGPKNLAQATARAVWLRGDEHLLTLDHTRAMGWKITKALKRAVAQHLCTLEPSLLLNHSRGGTFTQRDALVLCHPRTSDPERGLLFDYLVRRSKAQPQALELVEKMRKSRPRWEVVLGKLGGTPQAWRAAFPHMGPLAILRHLDNLIAAGLLDDPDVQARIQALLGKASYRVMPHQVYMAMRALLGLEQTPAALLQVLEQTLLATAASLQLQGESLVLIDVSGSMQATLNPQSEATHALLAAVLGVLIRRRTGGAIWVFDGRALPMPYSREAPLLQQVEWVLAQGGGDTRLGAALAAALPGFAGKRVVVLSDEQIHDDAQGLLQYWLKTNLEHKAYMMNTAGYSAVSAWGEGVRRIGAYGTGSLQMLALLEQEDPLQTVRSFAEDYWRQRSDSEGLDL
jgi:hypothetical protein